MPVYIWYTTGCPLFVSFSCSRVRHPTQMFVVITSSANRDTGNSTGRNVDYLPPGCFVVYSLDVRYIPCCLTRHVSVLCLSIQSLIFRRAMHHVAASMLHVRKLYFVSFQYTFWNAHHRNHIFYCGKHMYEDNRDFGGVCSSASLIFV